MKAQFNITCSNTLSVQSQNEFTQKIDLAMCESVYVCGELYEWIPNGTLSLKQDTSLYD